MSRLFRLSVILVLFLSLADHPRASSATLISHNDLNAQGAGRFVVFEGFMRST